MAGGCGIWDVALFMVLGHFEAELEEITEFLGEKEVGGNEANLQ